MLRRKIESAIRQHFESKTDRILIVEGARQVGKSFIIRHVCQDIFPHFVEINLADDYDGEKIFASVHTTEQFYMQVGILLRGVAGNREDTMVFLDEIQVYPHLLTMLKFLRQEARYSYIASGSLLGVALHKSTSIPIGSIVRKQMFPLDFEEFLWANNFPSEAIAAVKTCMEQRTRVDTPLHTVMLNMFRKYLLVGGLPDAVNIYVESQNIFAMRELQGEIHNLYGIDASKYDAENRLRIRRIYDLIPSTLESKKKRLVVKEIENKSQARYAQYQDDFEYLISSGIALEVRAISNPKFPLMESSAKNLLKLYLNDVGLLSYLLFSTNINAVLQTHESINMGAVYECVVAQELKAHGHKLFYYDNKKHGEVDFLIDDFATLSVLPIEVKSGKDYTVHSSLNHFINTPDYNITQGVVLCNNGEIKEINHVVYLPVYCVMFL